MAENSYNGSSDKNPNLEPPREKKVLHALESYLINAHQKAEAEIKRHPLEYAAGAVATTVATIVAEQYGLNHALTTLTAIAGLLAAGTTAAVVRRKLLNDKEGLNLPFLSAKEREIIRRVALGMAGILADLGRRSDKKALIAFAGALVLAVNLALPPSNTTVLPAHKETAEWVVPASAPPAPSAQFANLRMTVAYNPPVYSAPLTTVVTVQGLYSWPVNDNA